MSALATVQPTTALIGGNYTREQLELLKRTICKDSTDDEFALFVSTAQRMELDPFARQIHAVKRWDRKANREVMSIQVGIDGFRVSAARTGQLDGQEGPFWCGDDGVWREVWLDTKKPPAAAMVRVYRKGCAHPFTGVATYPSYVQTTRDGAPNSQWARGADYMLAKCAEAVALRKGFPERLSGAYTPEEMGADERDAAPAPAVGPMPANDPPASSQQSKPADTAKSKPPIDAASSQQAPSGAGLPAEEAKALGEMITRTKNVVELRKVANVLNKARPSMSTAQYEQLLKSYNDHEALLEDAAQAEQQAGGQ